MEILTDRETFVKLIDSPEARYDAFKAARAEERCTLDHAERFGPTEFDLAEYARWLRESDARGHDQGEPTPPEVLEHDRGIAPWWVTMPESDELDSPYTIADHHITAMGPDLKVRHLNDPEAVRRAARERAIRGRVSAGSSDFDQAHYRALGR